MNAASTNQALGPTIDDEPTLFAARYQPYRSLGQHGFLVVMIIVAGISFVCGTAFLLMGAWPVFGMFGLDALAIYWAFRLNFRQARACEEIVVTPSLIRLRHVAADGTVYEEELNPLWTRLHRELHEDYGLQRLTLEMRGRPYVIGGFLHTAQREELAEQLSRALAEARRGVVRSTF
ncbi:Protein of unknown function DUF2244, transmembrane [Ancylobacter novellus DSM 506]|uniref:DUF2244 domain-containing protein n=1 Tax=Ancylobacter novellus (strain ATCC 8093 / DSM 506 / JCM 20403 / CCM 1077 / IAM 12100 / NBRC 12443 / NCIMB 10456) TaxID=639283 RepID=D7A239_ANCN5|nr:DUF2244 domain-containing protein [Ancylobacter novellus]ADH87655.1 Protein of unknown function DUF2244, transmembrane [Ancylobacter novellus DSM 506]